LMGTQKLTSEYSGNYWIDSVTDTKRRVKSSRTRGFRTKRLATGEFNNK